MPGYLREPADSGATVPLPAIAGHLDAATRLPRSVRALEATAGLLSAGALVLGFVLLALRFAAPALVHGTGLSAAAGPETGRIVVQSAAGLLGEVLHWNRARLRPSVRPLIAVAIIVGEFAALWWCWWR